MQSYFVSSVHVHQTSPSLAQLGTFQSCISTFVHALLLLVTSFISSAIFPVLFIAGIEVVCACPAMYLPASGELPIMFSMFQLALSINTIEGPALREHDLVCSKCCHRVGFAATSTADEVSLPVHWSITVQFSVTKAKACTC